MADNFEQAFYSALDKVMDRDGRPGLHCAYGWIYGEWLALEDALQLPLRAVLFRHAADNGIISQDEPRLGNLPPVTLSMKQMARELGTGFETARRLADAAGIIPLGSRRSVAFTLDPAAVGALGKSSAATKSLRAAGVILQTGKRQTNALVKAGLLPRLPNGKIETSAITKLFDRICKPCRTADIPSDAINLAAAARNESVPLERAYIGVAGGALPYWIDKDKGLSGIFVRPSDLRSARSPTPDISLQAAAKQLGIHVDCARALHREGKFSAQPGRIDGDGLRAFDHRYVVGSQLARSLGCSPKSLKRRLEIKGIEPVFDPAKYRQAIYDRGAVRGSGLLN